MEKRSKNPGGTAAPSAGGKVRKRKRRVRKPLDMKDRMRAVLLSVALIVLAIMISVVTITLRSGTGTETVAVRPPAPPNEGPSAPAASAPPAEGPGAPAEPAPPAPQKAPEPPVPVKPPDTTVSPPEPVRTVPVVPAGSPPPKQTAPVSSPPARPAVPVKTVPAQESPLAGPPERPGPTRPRTLVFIIDDAGNNLPELEPFLRFPGPLTIAVLPALPHSAEAARRIRAAGKEVLLHQPMEALGGQNPGPGAIYTGMTAGEIRAIVERNLAEIGPVAGMNNHQGSKVTMDPELMEIILALCREHGIYFLDSRTTADTAAPAVAKRMGIKIGERDVFLDNIQEKAAMIRYVQDGLRQADQKGSAVMIGHTWSSELAETLAELYPDLVEEGYSLSTISRFMMGKADIDEWW
ncbi:MAG: divergent polysaccharide deacetylase family protein [Spirochaetaceae bacterium]|nr:divergent polysaccharide deacetylase family protein [Spirochaetaceae bacterium]